MQQTYGPDSNWPRISERYNLLLVKHSPFLAYRAKVAANNSVVINERDLIKECNNAVRDDQKMADDEYDKLSPEQKKKTPREIIQPYHVIRGARRCFDCPVPYGYSIQLDNHKPTGLPYKISNLYLHYTKAHPKAKENIEFSIYIYKKG